MITDMIKVVQLPELFISSRLRPLSLRLLALVISLANWWIRSTFSKPFLVRLRLAGSVIQDNDMLGFSALAPVLH
jgi:hypothetical protein